MAVDLQRRVNENPHRVLLVGEGNFSFTYAYALKHPDREIIATSYDSEDDVKEKYQDFEEFQEKISRLPNVTLLHDIDATRLEEYADWQTHKFDKIVFNFPHAGKRTHATANLINDFFISSRNVLQVNGTVQVTLVDTLQYDAYYNIRSSRSHRFKLIKRRIFDAHHFYKDHNYRHVMTNEDGSPKEDLCLKYIFRMIDIEDRNFDSHDEFLHSSDLSYDEGRFGQFHSVRRRFAKDMPFKTTSKVRCKTMLKREFNTKSDREAIKKALSAIGYFASQGKFVEAKKLYKRLAIGYDEIKVFKKNYDSIQAIIRKKKETEWKNKHKAQEKPIETQINFSDFDLAELLGD